MEKLEEKSKRIVGWNLPVVKEIKARKLTKPPTKPKLSFSFVPFLHEGQKIKLEMLDIQLRQAKLSLDEVKFHDVLNRIWGRKNKQQQPTTKKNRKNPFDNVWKFELIPTSKFPACKWSNPLNHQKTSYNPLRFNTGILHRQQKQFVDCGCGCEGSRNGGVF